MSGVSEPNEVAVRTIAEVQKSHRSTDRDSVSNGGLFLERHFNPAELAQIWGLSTTKIRRMFQDEPGVLRIGDHPEGWGGS